MIGMQGGDATATVIHRVECGTCGRRYANQVTYVVENGRVIKVSDVDLLRYWTPDCACRPMQPKVAVIS